MAVEMTVTLLLHYPLAGPYQTVLMPGIPVVGRTLLSLGRG